MMMDNAGISPCFGKGSGLKPLKIGSRACSRTDLRAADVENTAADRRAIGKIELMRGAVDRIDIDRSHYIETGGLETQTEASGSGTQVDSNRSHGTLP